MVGKQGFEPWAPCSQSMCASQLRYFPKGAAIITRGLKICKQTCLTQQTGFRAQGFRQACAVRSAPLFFPLTKLAEANIIAERNETLSASRGSRNAIMTELSASLQDYLEGIFFLEEEKGEARVADLAAFLKVRNPSVVKSLSRLKDLGMVEQKPYQAIALTAAGRTEAKKISRRHMVLKDFFAQILMIDDKTAEGDACRMEHVISPKTFERLTKFIEEYKVLKKKYKK